jgi:hypothetical protein
MKYTLKRGKTRTSTHASKRAQNSMFTPKGKSKNPKSKNPKSKNPKSKNPKSKNPKSKNPKSKNPKSKKTRQTNSSRLIPQKILSGHPALSKKRKNKRKRYISRNEVSPFRSVKEHLKDFNSPLAIV